MTKRILLAALMLAIGVWALGARRGQEPIAGYPIWINGWHNASKVVADSFGDSLLAPQGYRFARLDIYSTSANNDTLCLAFVADADSFITSASAATDDMVRVVGSSKVAPSYEFYPACDKIYFVYLIEDAAVGWSWIAYCLSYGDTTAGVDDEAAPW